MIQSSLICKEGKSAFYLSGGMCLSTEKSSIEVKTFFDGAQDITDAFVFLISRKNSRKASSESAPHLASEEDSEYNTDTKDINCLPSGYTGD